MHIVDVHKELEVDCGRDDIAALLAQQEVVQLPDKLAPARAAVHPSVMSFNLILI